MKHFVSVLICSLAVLSVYAQGPNNSGTYYKNADGQKGKNLKTAFAGIINSHTNVGYDGLWACYKTSDVRPDGKIWDMYSNTTNYDPVNDRAGSYSKEGDCYNREHSVPQSWFDSGSPMKSDLVHVVPTDGYVNNRRSNYPFGENLGEKYKSNGGFSKLGSCTTAGYSGVVFEPNDEYKGDFARIYFYMATCYESKISSWSSEMFDGTTYPALKTWALNMLLRWAADDPVSQKEIDRNNAVYELQGNRNPFVDYPGLEQYVWGDSKDMAFSYDNYEGASTGGGTDPGDGGETGGDGDDENPDITPAEGEQLYELVASTDGLTIGNGYLIVYVDGSLALSSSEGKYFSGASVTITNNQIATEVDKTGKPHQLILGGKAGAYTFYDPVEKAYLSLNSNDNALHTTESATDNVNAEWAIYFSGDCAQITSDAYSNRSIQYNTGSPRFACYKSGQKAVSLFGNKVASSIEPVATDYDNSSMDVYDLMGRKVATFEDYNLLPRGIYIISGRKVVKTW